MNTSSTDLLERATLQWFHEYSTQGMFTTDTELRIRSWNRWLTATTGLTEAAVVGHTVPEVLPSFVERGFISHYEAALTGTVTVLSHLLHRFILSHGSADQKTTAQAAASARSGTVSVSSAPSRDQDVSDRVASEAGAARANCPSKRPGGRLRPPHAKGRVPATLSHELRTPLNAVLGWTRILRSRELDAEMVHRAIEVIDHNASAQLR